MHEALVMPATAGIHDMQRARLNQDKRHIPGAREA
jgi:hypothetical protein